MIRNADNCEFDQSEDPELVWFTDSARWTELSSPAHRLFVVWPSVAPMLSSTFWCRNKFEAAVFIETAALRRPFNFLFRCIETEKEQMSEHI